MYNISSAKYTLVTFKRDLNIATIKFKKTNQVFIESILTISWVCWFSGLPVKDSMIIGDESAHQKSCMDSILEPEAHFML